MRDRIIFNSKNYVRLEGVTKTPNDLKAEWYNSGYFGRFDRMVLKRPIQPLVF